MKLSWFGRLALALFASLALGLGMSACGGGTIAYLWVLGQQYNQIASFKVDDYTGNLTQTPHQPFAAQGANPITILVKSGGRFVYVLNQGSGDTPTSNSGDAGVASSRSAVTVPSIFCRAITARASSPCGCSSTPQTHISTCWTSTRRTIRTTGNGSITAFSIDPTTGRLTLVLNTQSVPPNSPAPTYWEVGQNPLQMKQAGSCLFTVNIADQSITPYSLGGGGQLVNVTTGKIATSAEQYLVDQRQRKLRHPDRQRQQHNPSVLHRFSCGLSLTLGGVTQNQPGTSNPT